MAEQRNAFISGTTRRVNNIVIFEGLLTKAQLNSNTIRKSGTFNAASNGNLFGETLYGAIDKTSLFQVNQVERYIVR